MAGIASEETGVGRSVEVNSGAQNYQSSDALVEWRSSDQVENGMPSTSPPYWDSDDDDAGPKPSQLYGKHTWKIEKFSENTKRELRSEAFEVGGYKWYILIYPQGCDVCNHLSLFLCVANHDRLLPGWSHFAQFTIAVVNKDPKKSKYSDTLHRFWKKEHDWGWKKFMELSKVSEGFLDSADTLIIKAQVQVIREKTDRPFRCLDCVYRRELVRVYLTNLESICRRFMEDRQGKFGKLIEDKSRWTSLCAFWLGMDQTARRRMSREKTDTILKVMVKHFFIEKEVTSTLVMDSLYCGLKALEGYIQSQKGRKKLVDTEEMTAPIVHVEKDMFVLVDDVLLLLERAAVEPLPPKDDKGPQNRTKDGNSGEDLNKDSSERDERRLTELGRRTVEIFILAHIFNHKIEVAYQEAVALKRQEELIREEEFEAWLACSEQKTKNGGTERDKKSKKKPSKQKRNSRKGKDKGKDEKSTTTLLNKNQEENPINDKKESSVEEVQPVEEKADTLEDVSDMSDSIDFVAEVPQPDAEDRDASPVNWDTDASEGLPPTEQVSCNEVSGLSSAPNGAVERRNTSAMDDSSSTCSTDSILSVPVNGYGKENGHLSYQCEKSSSRGKKQRVKLSSDGSRTSDSDAGNLNAVNGVSRSGESVAGQGTVSRTEQHAVRKEQEDDQFQKKWSVKCTVDSEQSSKGKAISALSLASSPMSPERNGSSPVQLKSDNKHSPTADCDTVKLKKSLSCIQQSDKSSLSTLLPHSSVMTKAENQHAVSLKLSDGKVQQQVPPVSRPSSAPLVPGPRPTTPAVSLFQTSPLLARSVSVASRLGPDASMATQGYVPQSYRNAILGSTHSSTSGFSNSSYLSSNSAMPPAHTQPPSAVSSPMLLPQNSGRIEPGNIYKGTQVSESGKCMDGPQKDVGRSMPGDPSYLTNGFRNLELHQSAQSGFCDWSSSELPACTSGRQTQGMVTDEFPHLDIINDLLDDEYGAGIAAGTGRIFHPVSNGPQLLNRQFSFPGEVGASSNLSSSTSSSCRFERTRSYHDVGFGRGYSSVAAYLDSVRDFIPQANPHPFLNDQIEGMIPNQWQLGGANHSIMDMRNIDSEGLAYLNPRFPNVVNGYTVYRPSNGY